MTIYNIPIELESLATSLLPFLKPPVDPGVIIDENGNPGPNWQESWSLQGVPGALAPDGKPAMQYPAALFGLTNPHPNGVAGAPQNNGIAFNCGPYTKLVADVIPTKDGFLFSTLLYSVSGKFLDVNAKTDDVGLTPNSIISPTVCPKNVVTTVEFNLSDLGIVLGMAGLYPWTYKVSAQANGPNSNQVWYLRNFKFV